MIFVSSIPTPASVRLRGILTFVPTSTIFEEAPITGFSWSPVSARSVVASLSIPWAATLAVTFPPSFTTSSFSVIAPVVGFISIPSFLPFIIVHWLSALLVATISVGAWAVFVTSPLSCSWLLSVGV